MGELMDFEATRAALRAHIADRALPAAVGPPLSPRRFRHWGWGGITLWLSVAAMPFVGVVAVLAAVGASTDTPLPAAPPGPGRAAAAAILRDADALDQAVRVTLPPASTTPGVLTGPPVSPFAQSIITAPAPESQTAPTALLPPTAQTPTTTAVPFATGTPPTCDTPIQLRRRHR